MFRAVLISAVLLVSMPPAPVQAQESPEASADTGTTCQLSERKKRGSAMFGSVLGGLANRALGGRASAVTSFVPVNTLATVLTDAIACRLDADEQRQAAAATEDALTRGEGATASWTSTTRPGVSGSSTVAAQTASADGGTCMAVNDVIIVDGEETTVSKRMCRAPGATGYTIASA